MNPRIVKLKEEREKLAQKIVLMQTKLKALDEQIIKLENMDIVGAVRQRGLTVDQLVEVMKLLSKKPTVSDLELNLKNTSVKQEKKKEEDVEDEK